MTVRIRSKNLKNYRKKQVCLMNNLILDLGGKKKTVMGLTLQIELEL